MSLKTLIKEVLVNSVGKLAFLNDIANHLGVIALSNKSTAGMQIDNDYPWDDLRGEYILDPSGANAPSIEVFATGNEDLGFNATNVVRTRLHIMHNDVVGGVKKAHPHVFIALGATAATTDLVLSHAVTHSYGSIGSGETRGTPPATITIAQTITVAEINAIGSGKNKAFDFDYANSGGTGGLLNSDNMFIDDIIRIKTTVTSTPTITGGTSAKVGLLPIDGHRQVKSIGSKYATRLTTGSFYN